ncbi:ABC transporter permease subunit [Serratia marcescens]|uniref:ABC transporter permease subunit n=1 Tax=Serratia marcescens TaxID=615 RepID=UPI00132ED90D|nr:ABC transporter ATP-binding protein [Serratia marcescens]BBO63148.1 branched-chain amino acid ABC transporter permease [Serratia marcescens]
MTVLTPPVPLATPRRAGLGLTLFILALLLAPWVAGAAGGNYWVRVVDFALLYLMLALGLNIVVGMTGLLDMGFIAFYAVGAYLAALLSSPHLTQQFPLLLQWFPDGLHLPMLWLIPLAALLAAVCGILLGAPTLRLRGDYLAIVTLGFGEIVRILMRNLDRPVNLTNGPKGISGIDPVSLFGLRFSGMHEWFGVRFSGLYLYYYLFAALLLAILFISLRLQNSRIGRAWTAIREDEDAARAMGINTRNFKLLAFAIGATFGGVAGALFAAFQGFVSPESFTLQESIAVLAMVVLGGMGPLQQALFGQVLIDPEIIRQLFYGLALILVMLYRPAGLWPARHAGRTAA